LQGAAYAKLAIENGLLVNRVMSIRPHRDGNIPKPAGVYTNIDYYYNLFLSALNLYHYFNNNH